jgi:hypothetical protein
LWGYTENESRFLYLIATHSGYFFHQHYADFLGIAPNKRTSTLIRKALRNRHIAVRTELRRRGYKLYHLYSRNVYDDLGAENSSLRKVGTLNLFLTRLLVTSFIISYPDEDYLETEADKVRYFQQCGIDVSFLPRQRFRSRKRHELVTRYFADKFPIFVEDPSHPRPNILKIKIDLATRQKLGLYCRFSNLSQDAVIHRALEHVFKADSEFQSCREREKNSAAAPNDSSNRSVQVVFTYFDNGQIGIDGFTTYLQRYKPLLDSLQGNYKILYVSNSERNFKKAEAQFREIMNPERDQQILVDYFPRRLLWEQKKYNALAPKDHVLLRRGERKLIGPYFENLYAAWLATENPAEKAALLQLPAAGRFDTHLIEEMRL